jgi:hypothetical protein
MTASLGLVKKPTMSARSLTPLIVVEAEPGGSKLVKTPPLSI